MDDDPFRTRAVIFEQKAALELQTKGKGSKLSVVSPWDPNVGQMDLSAMQHGGTARTRYRILER